MYQRSRRAFSREAPLQQTAGRFAPRPFAVQARRVGTKVVQRDVGFELETGWLVTQEDSQVQKPLKKKDPVGAGGYAGFNIEADEALNGASEVEFVVHPPLPVADGGLGLLNTVMSGVTAVGSELKQAGETSNGATFKLSAATGRQADDPWEITPSDTDLKAGPQVTAGILQSDIPKLGVPSKEAPLPYAFNKTVMTGASNQSAIESLDLSTVVLPDNTMSPELVGLLHVIIGYLRAGESRGLEYPKQIADSFVLARTDLAKMFKMLPKKERDFFQTNASHWLNLVMQVAKAAEIEGDATSQVILYGVRPNPLSPFRKVGPQRDIWLIYLTKGADILSGTIEDELESMGALEDKTEPVGPDQKAAPIFELRGAQTTKIPLTEWTPFAVQVYKYLLAMQDPGAFKAEKEREEQEKSRQSANLQRQKYMAKLGFNL